MSKELPEQHKLASVTFVNSVSFGGRNSFAIGTNCESIVPAQLQPDGDWAGIDKGQRPDGLGIRVRVVAGNERRIRRFFVPFTNISDMGYSE
jgi:hypothetical protein